jgi:uncharacterized membrane protein YhaH (DUF805 family)
MWKRAFDFKGETRVWTFWWSIIFNFIIYASIIWILALNLPLEEAKNYAIIYPIVSFIPLCALVVRRLNNACRSVFNLLWLFVPYFGWIVFLVLLSTRSRIEKDREFDRYHW